MWAESFLVFCLTATIFPPEKITITFWIQLNKIIIFFAVHFIYNTKNTFLLFYIQIYIFFFLSQFFYFIFVWLLLFLMSMICYMGSQVYSVYPLLNWKYFIELSKQFPCQIVFCYIFHLFMANSSINFIQNFGLYNYNRIIYLLFFFENIINYHTTS